MECEISSFIKQKFPKGFIFAKHYVKFQSYRNKRYGGNNSNYNVYSLVYIQSVYFHSAHSESQIAINAQYTKKKISKR